MDTNYHHQRNKIILSLLHNFVKQGYTKNKIKLLTLYILQRYFENNLQIEFQHLPLIIHKIYQA